MLLVLLVILTNALIISTLVYMWRSVKSRKLRRAGRAEDIRVFNEWMQTCDIENPDMQRRISFYKAEKPITL